MVLSVVKFQRTGGHIGFKGVAAERQVRQFKSHIRYSLRLFSGRNYFLFKAESKYIFSVNVRGGADARPYGAFNGAGQSRIGRIACQKDLIGADVCGRTQSVDGFALVQGCPF